VAVFESVRVAAVQATPVILDAEATVDKAIALLDQAADDGASGAWAAAAATWTAGCDELWERLWASSVDVGGPLVRRLASACGRRGVHLAIGVNEREDDRPGSLYNTLLVLGPEGLLHRHRKLMPTMHERVFHGVGAGDDLGVVELPGTGRVGGLICWENRMPLARWAVYQGGPQIWLAPTADDSDGWLASMRHIAIEAGAYVVSVPQYIPTAAFPSDFPLPLPEGIDVFGRGGACIVAPNGELIAGPRYDAEAMVTADCDLRQALHAKRYFDVAGHYGRADVLGP
jgi:predicted amidohydrolase